MRRITIFSIALGLLIAAMPAPPAAANSLTVVMKNVTFSPSPLKARLGDTITWANRDIIAHKIVADSGGFAETPLLQPGKDYRTKITKAGTLAYHDSLNPTMRGTLIVSSIASATPKPTPRPTVRPTPKPTPKPTAKPTVKPAAAINPTATASSAAVAVTGSPEASGPPAGSGTATSTGGSVGSAGATGDVSGGTSGPDIGIWILLFGVLGLAFAAGIWFSASRRHPPFGEPAIRVGLGSSGREDVAPTTRPGIALSESRSPAPHEVDEVDEVDEDAPLEVSSSKILQRDDS